MAKRPSSEEDDRALAFFGIGAPQARRSLWVPTLLTQRGDVVCGASPILLTGDVGGNTGRVLAVVARPDLSFLEFGCRDNSLSLVTFFTGEHTGGGTGLLSRGLHSLFMMIAWLSGVQGTGTGSKRQRLSSCLPVHEYVFGPKQRVGSTSEERTTVAECLR